MPIRPENKDRYPKDWKAVVVPRIRARSGNRCECTGQCGRIHNRRQELGGMTITKIEDAPRCNQWNGMPIDEIEGPKIVLTVAHLNHQPEDCSDGNLIHMCQKCHNRYDAPVRAAGIKARRRALMASADLFPK